MNDRMNNELVIGIYPRKSVYRDNSESVSLQIKTCKDYAKIVFSDKKIKFIIYGKDEGFSGENSNRPSFLEMMSDIISSKLNIVIVYKLDRISRNMQEFTAIFGIMEANHVDFISVKEAFDTSTPIGKTVMYILAAFAELERLNTSERVTDGMKQLGITGHWTGGVLPTGFTSIRKTVDNREHSYLIVDNNAINLVKILFDKMLAGYTITGVERYCRDNNIKSKNGSFISSGQIYSILTNPVYCQNDVQAYYYFKEKGCSLPDIKMFDSKNGLIAYNRTKGSMSNKKLDLNGLIANGHTTGSASNKKLDMSKWIVSIGIHAPVIPADQYIEVQNRLGQNKQIRKQKYEVGILKGVLRCKCNGMMHNRVYIKNGIMFAYYFCSNMSQRGKDYCNTEYVRIDKIDQLFIDQLMQIRLDEDYITPRKIETSNADTDISLLKKEIKATEHALNNLTTQLQKNVKSTAAKYIINQIETLDNELNSLNIKLISQTQKKNYENSEQEDRNKILQNITFLLDNFDDLTYKEKNDVIKRTVKKCVLNGTNLEISF